MLLKNVDLVQAKDFTTSKRLVLVLTGGGGQGKEEPENRVIFNSIQSSDSFWIRFLPHLVIKKNKNVFNGTHYLHLLEKQTSQISQLQQLIKQFSKEAVKSTWG